MVSEVDGLDKPWDGINVPTSLWDGDMGQLEHDDVPASFHQLLSPADVRNYDSTSLGTPFTSETDNASTNLDFDEDCIESGEIRVVRYLPMAYFRGKLIDHFDIMW
eukprot:CCRYP_016545-RA/>CCRYP_016545-RA protein AED:0.39 eAED:0.39 QI:0/-1/0/1/-1/1/1/0/105